MAWPTTGGIRLDQSAPTNVKVVPVKDDEDYKEADSLTVAVKINGTTRITRRFDPKCGVNEVFKWVEKHLENSEAAFYTLLQTVPNRRFVKYANGSIEIIKQNDPPMDIGNASLAEAGFESHEMFMFRCD
ncbi:machado-joseph disease protein [Babesia ovata]|uniref:Machado-joseph disease protein n=1 Tax=Babesia ovata TaxID=189622 RepID=A0A2H6KEI5_9APIC|nr:machado-joseph disease protein [Babesia ovata]GBE61410.1 machado-joseph disease protein [Babesia ovata]